MSEITLNALAAFPDQLEAHFGAIADDWRLWSPSSWQGCPSEPYPALEQICHIRDIEIDGYHVRFVRALREDNPHLPAMDGEKLRIERGYAEASAPDVLAEFRRARQETLELLGNLSHEQWNRRAVFEDYGPTTVTGLMHYLCSHDQQHLAGLQWLLGKSLVA